MRRRAQQVATALALVLVAVSCTAGGTGTGRTPEPLPPDQRPSQPAPTTARVVATNLAAPWGIDFLPDGDALITERDSTRVLRVTPQGRVSPVAMIEEAQPRGEGGLLGLAVSPTFADDRWVYLYYTTGDDNRIVRFRYRGGAGLSGKQVLVDGIPASSIHNGGRLVFGPGGMLFASTGEAGQQQLAQDLDSLGGKTLRLTPTGQPAPGNPFGDSLVFSYGHRNIEGLAFDDAGRLYASEFGANAFDEVNRIRPGSNYGWPIVEGFGGGDRFTQPLLTWKPSEASPAGAAITEGSLWVAALAGNRLYRVPLGQNGRVGQPQALLTDEYGRLRTVARTPRGTLWVTTSNRDSRGDPAPQDDRILVLDPQAR